MNTKKVLSFQEFLCESKNSILSDNKTESAKNYVNYMNGKEPLRHAIITHREGDSMYDYIKGNLTHGFCVLSHDDFEKQREKRQKEVRDTIINRIKSHPDWK